MAVRNVNILQPPQSLTSQQTARTKLVQGHERSSGDRAHQTARDVWMAQKTAYATGRAARFELMRKLFRVEEELRGDVLALHQT
jgi:hypothetical protein